MRNQNPTRPTLTRIIAGILTWAFIAGQITQPVYAVLTPLGDVPIAAKVAAKPNIVYTLDDSGSMQLNYVPDFVVSAQTALTISAISRIGPTAKATVASTAALFTGQYVNIAGANQPEYNGQFAITVINATQFTFTVSGAPAAGSGTITYTTGSAYCRSGNNVAVCSATLQGNSTFTSPPFFAADFNRMMYNPNVTYYPPLKADGTPVTIAGVTDANGNMGTTVALYAGVQRDVYLQMFAAGVKDNLQTRVSVPLYCNTDWPVTAGVNLAITDIGNNQGQTSVGTGSYCRINGNNYDVSAASGAPATAVTGVEMGYNYPWQSSSGAKGAQYFYQQLNVKTLWCDKTSPYWPQTATLTGCIGGTPTYAAAAQQKCNQNAKTCNPTPALRNFVQTACKNVLNSPFEPSSKYCAPGVNGSDGNSPGTSVIATECLACNCLNDYQPAGGKCSINTGVSCVAPYGTLGTNAACPDVPGALTGCGTGTNVYTYAPAGSANCTTGMWDPVAKVTTGTTLLADSNANGLACRHNNQTYAVAGAPLPSNGPTGLFIYSRTHLGDVYTANKSAINGGPGTYNQLGQFTTSVTTGCPIVGTTIAIPRHYYTIDSVGFCDNRNNTINDQWRGFGTGTCPASGKNDLTQFKNVQYGPFHRWDLYAIAAGASPTYNPGAFVYPGGRIWLAASPTPANSESVNYANWYAGYATRLNAAKTTSGIAFSYLTPQGTDPIAYRVGFHNLGEESPPNGGGTPIIWVDVKDWDLAQRTAWYSALYGIKSTNYKTATISAMLRIGNLFEKGGSAGVDPVVNPLPGGALDPIATDASGNLISCQNNYHILFTDGYTNQIGQSSRAGEFDLTVPPFTSITQTPAQMMPNLISGSPWPRPFKQGPVPATISNTLADVAAYYWGRDLRDGTFGLALKNDVPATVSNSTSSTDLDPTKDVAWWQHVNFSALSFGSDGVLDAGKQKATLAAIIAGTQVWPNLTNPWNPIYPLGTGAGAVAVDDLWHATILGRGSFVYAKSPVEVSYGLANILAGIQNQRTSRTGSAFNGQVLDAGNNVIFSPTIEPGWGGDLLKIEINPSDGSFVKTWWNATIEVARQIKPVSADDQPWMDPLKRRIVTLANGVASGRIAGPGVPFQYTDLLAAPVGPAMLNSLAADPLRQQKMIAYLRGGSTFGPVGSVISIEGTGIGQFRQRPSAGLDPITLLPLGSGLGDISNAAPVIVGPPDRTYNDATDPGYSAYKIAKAARATVVVAPANDGMVHVINAGPMPKLVPLTVVAAGGGDELFAFMPRSIFRGVAGTTAGEDTTGVQALTYQDGGVPIYRHHMYVDASPRAADVDFDNGQGSPNWRTIVVGGLGKGGNSFYALDLTDLNVPNEAAAAGKVLWEWNNPDADVGPGSKLLAGGSPGFAFARPVIVKVRQSGYPTGRWVAIVTGGYNNASGKGKVFFLDAKTGQLLSTVTTSGATSGTTINPSGLAQIHGFVRDESDQTIEQIYGGDLLGNAWRIDVSARSTPTASPDYGANVFNGAGATAPTTVLFAQFVDPSSAPQPVTTAPQIEIDLNNGIDRYVFFGTGRLLHSDDLTVPAIPQQQTYYAIRDGSLVSVKTAGLPIQPRITLSPINIDKVSAIVGGAPNGWYQDLPNNTADPIRGAQRIIIDPQSSVNIASYVGTKTQDDPCLINLPAFLYARDYTSAASLIEVAGAIVPDYSFGNGLNTAAIAGGTHADGSIGLLVVGIPPPPPPGSSTNPVEPVNIKNPVTGPGTRWSWRMLTGQ